MKDPMKMQPAHVEVPEDLNFLQNAILTALDVVQKKYPPVTGRSAGYCFAMSALHAILGFCAINDDQSLLSISDKLDELSRAKKGS